MAAKLISLSSGMLRSSRTVPTLTRNVPWLNSTASFQTTSFRLNQYVFNVQDEEDFKNRVLQSKTPVIVDFHASWCGPCRILGPRLEALVGKEEGKVLLAKVDIDEMSDLSVEHGVQAVPTVLAMKDGKIQDKFVGVKDNDQLISFIKNITGQ